MPTEGEATEGEATEGEATEGEATEEVYIDEVAPEVEGDFFSSFMCGHVFLQHYFTKVY